MHDGIVLGFVRKLFNLHDTISRLDITLVILGANSNSDKDFQTCEGVVKTLGLSLYNRDSLLAYS